MRSITFEIIRVAGAKAAMVKREGLDSGDERLRQDVSTEILDRILGRATQRTEISGEEGGPLTFSVVYEDEAEDGET